jgi:hypothetical protein
MRGRIVRQASQLARALIAILIVLALAPSSASAAGTGPRLNAVVPSIVGTPTDGQTLKAAKGKRTGQAKIYYAYQWKRCDSSGSSCVNIASASKATTSSSQKMSGKPFGLWSQGRTGWAAPTLPLSEPDCRARASARDQSPEGLRHSQSGPDLDGVQRYLDGHFAALLRLSVAGLQRLGSELREHRWGHRLDLQADEHAGGGDPARDRHGHRAGQLIRELSSLQRQTGDLCSSAAALARSR